MNLRQALISASLIPLLGSCGPPPKHSSDEDSLRAADATASTSVKRQPGSWTMIHYTMAFDAENVTGGMAEMVKAGQASVGKKEFGGPLCLDAELAAKDELAARLKEAIHFGPGFRDIHSGVKDGKVDFAAVREDPVDGKSRITITGILTSTTTDLIVTTDAWQPAPGKGHIRTVMKQENSRVGDCSPGQDPWQ